MSIQAVSIQAVSIQAVSIQAVSIQAVSIQAHQVRDVARRQRWEAQISLLLGCRMMVQSQAESPLLRRCHQWDGTRSVKV